VLNPNNKKFIWIIGVPRSGTTFLTDYLCQYVNICYNEPWESYDHKHITQWTFPNVKSIVFKYCVNWSYANILNEKFRKSYFIHLIRDPAQVVYSLVFPKLDSYPYRDILKGNIEEKFKQAVSKWYLFICGSQEVCKKFRSIELIYEKIDQQINILGQFLNLPLQKKNFIFNFRNNKNVEPSKFELLETFWKSQDFILEFNKRQEIELIIYD